MQKRLVVDVPRLLLALDMHEAVKRGSQWHALCPAHADHKASWAIRDEPGDAKHGVHGCWACKWGGDAIELARKVLGLGTRAIAREWVLEHGVARKGSDVLPLAIEFEYETSVRAAFRMPGGVKFEPIDEWPKAARSYLLRDRHIPRWQVERWGIGYAVDGLLIGRIVLPIVDDENVLLSYTARTYSKAPMRYRNPNRRENADPGAIWGEAKWTADRSVLWLAEGAFKAMAVERVRDKASVGAVGGASSLTLDKVAKLSAWSRIVVVSDPDPAGDRFVEELKSALVNITQVDVVRTVGGDADEIGDLELERQISSAYAQGVPR